MYADPKRIRKHVIKVCLDGYQTEVIDRLVRETGGQRQTIVYELLKKSLEHTKTATQSA